MVARPTTLDDVHKSKTKTTKKNVLGCIPFEEISEGLGFGDTVCCRSWEFLANSAAQRVPPEEPGKARAFMGEIRREGRQDGGGARARGEGREEGTGPHANT